MRLIDADALATEVAQDARADEIAVSRILAIIAVAPTIEGVPSVERLAMAIHEIGKAGAFPEDRYIEVNSDQLAADLYVVLAEQKP